MAASVDSLITDYDRLLACKLVSETAPYNTLFYAQEIMKKENPTKDERTYLVYDGEKLKTLKDLVSLGWFVIDSSDDIKNYIGAENEYRGLILFHQKKGLLLVHRGMQLNHANIANCLLLATMEKPPIVKDALEMCERAVELAKNRYLQYDIHHTGFSMGGFLAQITATYCNHNKERRHNKAVGYDCPGANFVLEAEPVTYGDNKENITVCLTDINLVNTATPHYGHVKQILEFAIENDKCIWPNQPLHFNFDSPSALLINQKELEYVLYIVNRTIQETHSINEILILLNQKESDLKCREIRYWPVARNTFHEESNALVAVPSRDNSNADLAQAIFNGALRIVDMAGSLGANEIFGFAGVKYTSVTHELADREIVPTDNPCLVEHNFNQAKKLKSKKPAAATPFWVGDKARILRQDGNNPSKALGL